MTKTERIFKPEDRRVVTARRGDFISFDYRYHPDVVLANQRGLIVAADAPREGYFPVQVYAWNEEHKRLLIAYEGREAFNLGFALPDDNKWVTLGMVDARNVPREVINFVGLRIRKLVPGFMPGASFGEKEA